MYTRPDMNSPVDRLAHLLSEVHNDRAPIGWENYKLLSRLLLRKLPIENTVMDENFFEYTFQTGTQEGK